MDIITRLMIVTLILILPVPGGGQSLQRAAAWETVAARTDYPLPGNAGQVFRFEPHEARCVRIEATRLRPDPGDGDRYRLQFAEIEVFIQNPTGEQHSTINVALGAKAIASSSFEYVGWGLDHINDGAWNSKPDSMGWSSDSNTANDHSEQVTLHLGGSYLIRSVVLYPRNDGSAIGRGFPQDFTVQISADSACLHS